MRKKSIYTMFLFLIVLVTLGCADQKKEDSKYVLYYINSSSTGIDQKDYEMKATESFDMVKELLKELKDSSHGIDYQSAIPENVSVVSFDLTDSQLSIFFDTNYHKMSASRELLCRAAVVKTLLQVSGVQSLSFYVDGAPLTNKDGTIVGVMNSDTFIDNPGKEINNLPKTNITLYFANKTGDQLVPEKESVHSSATTSVEKLIVERLLEGPRNSDLLGTIPSGTKLINVSLADGICYVNLDDGFLNQNYKIKEEIVIYSIVDSLTELPEVNKVQISVNGNSSMNYRDNLSLNTQFTRNLDYLHSEEETETTIETTENK